MMKPTSKSIQKVGRFLRKTFGNIKSTICSGEYHNLPNTPQVSPLSCSRRRCPKVSQTRETKETYTVICCDTAVADNVHKKKLFNQHKKKEKKVSESLKEAKIRGDALAQKLKYLNMVDLRDVEHSLDVREALRCYSSIRSPVYLDIVDNFFTDMYYEFSDLALLPLSPVQEEKRAPLGSKTLPISFPFRLDEAISVQEYALLTKSCYPLHLPLW